MDPTTLSALHDVRAVLLDRDGVLCVNLDGGVRSLAEWQWLDGAMEAVRELAAHGLAMKVITNQANIGRGLVTPDQLREIHEAMLADLGPGLINIDDILYCPHRPEEDCFCRKPRPGLVAWAVASLGFRPEQVLVVGDHETDLLAAASAGCLSVHVRCGRGAAPLTPILGYHGSVESLCAVVGLLRPIAGKIERAQPSTTVEWGV